MQGYTVGRWGCDGTLGTWGSLGRPGHAATCLCSLRVRTAGRREPAVRAVQRAVPVPAGLRGAALQPLPAGLPGGLPALLALPPLLRALGPGPGQPARGAAALGRTGAGAAGGGVHAPAQPPPAAGAGGGPGARGAAAGGGGQPWWSPPRWSARVAGWHQASVGGGLGWGAPPFCHPKRTETLLPPHQRMELDDFWKQLQELEQHLDQVAQTDVQHCDRLARLSRELGGLNRTASHLQILLGTVAAAGFGGKSIWQGFGFQWRPAWLNPDAGTCRVLPQHPGVGGGLAAGGGGGQRHSQPGERGAGDAAGG